MTPPASPLDLVRQETEAQWQRRVLERARLGRFMVYHTRYSVGSNAGWPDLVLVRPGHPGRLIFAELKTERGKLTVAQELWIEALRSAGAEVYVWRPSDVAEVDRVLVGGAA